MTNVPWCEELPGSSDFPRSCAAPGAALPPGLPELTALAAQLCEAPYAVVSLLDPPRDLVRVGLDAAEPAAGENSFCAHLREGMDLLVVPNAATDFRFVQSPLVTGAAGVRFYAGAPLLTPERAIVGVLAVMDRVPRTLTPAQTQALQVLSRQATVCLEHHRQDRALQAAQRKQRALFEMNPDCVKLITPEGILREINATGLRLIEAEQIEQVVGQNLLRLVVPEEQAAVGRLLQAIAEGATRTGEHQITTLKGNRLWVEMHGQPYLDEDQGENLLICISRDITERKRVEEELRVSRQRLYAFMEYSPALTWIVDGDGLFYYGSPSFCHSFGIPQGQIAGKTLRELFDPAYVDGYLADNRTVLREHRLLVTEEPARLGDGTVGQFLSAKFPIEAPGDELLIGGIALDITERKRVEAQLRLLETCVARLNDIVIITEAGSIDEPGPRVLFVNEAFVRRLGYAREEVVGRPWRFLEGPKTSVAELQRIWEAMAAAKPVRAELISYTKGGDELWLEIEIVPVADETGQSTHFVAVERDISERKRSEGRFRRLFASNAQGVIFASMSGRILDANETFLRMLGYDREEVISGCLNWMALTPPEFHSLDARAIEELTARGACAPFEKEYLRQDGSRVPVLIGIATFDDNPDEVVAFVLDLTERKRLEQQSLRAQRLDSLGTLAGGIAHDLNNVLGPILTAVDLLQMKFPDPDSLGLIGIINECAQRGADMVRQVLSFARGMDGRRMRVEIAGVVKEIEKIVQDTFLKHIRVRTVVPAGVWAVLGDPTQLHQLLLNLCVNARDAMPKGGSLVISVENVELDAPFLSRHPEARPGPYVLLQVRDSGTGMPPEIVEKIFDPFFTTKDLDKGTGLGLSTSLAIVKSHHGFLLVESAVGKGTKFKIFLPGQKDSTGSTGDDRPPEIPRGQGELILMVEDEAPLRTIGKRTLEAYGYRVLTAGDGEEAVAVFASHHQEIAVVFTDVNMPNMDGLAAIRALRRMKPDVPIVATSGLATSIQVGRVADLGVEHFLPKPYTTETLLRILKQALADRG